LTQIFIFEQLFSLNTRNWLATELNKNVTNIKPKAGVHDGQFTADNLTEIAVTFMLAIVEPEDSWTTFKENKDRVGTKKHMLDRLIKHLDIPWKKLFELVNKDFKRCIQAAGQAAGDETIWGWKGKDVAVVHIDRKPDSDGFKVITLALEMTRTKR